MEKENIPEIESKQQNEKTNQSIKIDTVSFSTPIKRDGSLNDQKYKKTKRNYPTNRKSKAFLWTIKITLITFLLAGVFSLISEFANLLHFTISIVLLILLVVLSLFADAIGVAVTSCNPEPIYAMASRKEPHSKQALLLVKNSEKVANICCDVIGDICGIVSGACLIAIVVKLTSRSPEENKWLLTIVFSSVVASFTVGGKALFKDIAVNKSKEIVLLTAKLISVFYNPKEPNSRRKKK